MAIAQLAFVSLDCAEPVVLADFWAALLGGTIVHRTDDVHVVHTERGALAVVRVPDYAPPSWPNGPTPNHMHLDLHVEDLDAAQAVAVELGAEVSAEQPGPDHWRVLLDPAGHPFCLTVRAPLLPLGPLPETSDG
jgi:hypothetical protein